MAVPEEDLLTSFHTEAGDEDAAEPDFDTTVAHPARVWDYLLGGKDNFAADRTAGEQVLQVMPEMGLVARAGREFLARAVRYLAAEAGIRQFLDIGTGLPTADNTHEVAQRDAPESRIVYVDNDPIVLTHARALLTSDPRGETAYISADIRDTDTILGEAGHTLDFTQPVAVMLLAILHFIPDSDQPHAIVRRLMQAVPSGSYLVISHASSDIMAQTVEAGAEIYNEHSAVSINLRSEQQVTQFFDGLDLVPPGVTPLGHWRPEPVNVGALPWLPTYTAVGRKP
jgi:S-adenosyl methyltransferase